MNTFDKEKAIKQYTELSRLIEVGAYDELEHDGSYPEDGDDVLKDMDELTDRAHQNGLKFVGPRHGPYTLEAMTEQELAEYKAATER
jgi:pyruvate carboxylase